MAETPHNKNSAEIEIPDNLDDDLGDDWESAFQAEDFIFSEETGDDGFLAGTGTNDLDISTLVEGTTVAQKKPAAETTSVASEKTSGTEPPQEETSSPAVSRLNQILSTLAASALSLPGWYSSRPILQRILLPAIPLLLCIIGIGFLFSNTTKQQLQEQALQESPPETVAVAALDQTEDPVLPGPAIQGSQPVAETKTPALPDKKFRKKWTLPSFFIAAGDSNNPSLFVSIDLTLILQLGPDKQLPEDRLSYLRDSIFQFYRNRPAYELKHFALARGEMIRQLNNWLKKEWPDSPISTIMFNRYQVIS